MFLSVALTAITTASVCAAQPTEAHSPDETTELDGDEPSTPEQDPRSSEPPKAEAPAPKEPPPNTDVSIFGDRDDEIDKVPGSRSLVTAEEIKRMGPTNTMEIIRRVPSLTVSSEDGHGLRLNVGLRGFDPTRSRSVLVLEDGIPIAINPYGEPDLYYSTTVDRVRAVELVKGSGAVLYGPQTIAGVLNFITPSPPDKPEALTMIEAGQFGFFHALARFGDAAGDVRYLGQFSFRRADGPADVSLTAIDTMAKIAFPTGRNGEMNVKIGAYNERSNSTYLGLTRDMFEADPERGNLAPEDEFNVRRLEASVSHTQRLSTELTLRNTFYGYLTDRTWRRQRYDRAEVEGVEYIRVEGDELIPLGAIYFRDSSLIRDRHYQVVGFESQLKARVSTGPVRHTMQAGVRLHAEFGQRNESFTDFAGGEAGALQLKEVQTVVALAGYVQDRMAFTDWLLVTPGVRLELAGYDRSTLREPIDGVPTDVNFHGTSSAVGAIPGVGMVVGTPVFHGFGGIHLGWAPPRVSSAVTPDGRDAELSAERSTNIEAGIRSKPVKGLTFEADGFLTLFANQIVPATLSSGVQSELVNGGSTRHAGAEGQATINIGQLADIGFDLSFVGRYTFVDARFRGGPFDGNLLPYAPQHHGAALLDFAHPIGAGAQISWSVVGPQMTDEANNELADATGRVGEIPIQNVLDASVRWTIPRTGLTPTLSMKNAINDVYIATRRPDGIHQAGFRQIIAGLRWETQ